MVGNGTSTGMTRRRFLGYAVAAPTLAVGVRMADAVVGRDAPAGAQVAELVDFTDALTLAALPTQHLLVIEVRATNRVVVRLPRAEVGQGITTAVAQIVAEELDARLADVDVMLEDARPELLFNQLTGGSNTVHALYGPLRAAAAGARARLVTAAAVRWSTPAGELVAVDTTVVAPDGRTATYGELSAAAATVTVPAVPPVPKDPDDFAVVGRPTTRIDARDIVTGRARYTQDLTVAGCPAVCRGPPAHPRGDGAHRRRRGRPVDAGCRGRRPHPQRRGRGGRLVRPGSARPATPLSSTGGRDPAPACPTPTSRRGWRPRTRRSSSRRWASLTVDRSFEFAFVPHAPLEVLNCVADVRADRAELWLPSKSPIVAAQSVALALGLPPDRVTLHVVRGGGSFGRRLFFDPAIEAALVSRAVGRPVRLLWTRADDMHHGRLRPASHHRARATHLLGQVLSYDHRMASVALDGSHGLGELLTAVGAQALGAVGPAMFQLSQIDLYHFGAQTRSLREVDLAFPTGSWRSVFSGQVRTVDEVMVDELARALAP